MLGRHVSLIPLQEPAGDLAGVLAQPVRHRDFLLQDALADPLRLLITRLFGRGNENFITRDFHVLECVTGQRALEPLRH